MKVVDSDIAVDALRGRTEATELLVELARHGPPVASEITRFEVLAGAREHELEATEQLLSQFVFVPVMEAIARRGAGFARHHRARNRGISNEDFLIAGVVAELDAELVTRNVRHYPMFEGLTPAY